MPRSQFSPYYRKRVYGPLNKSVYLNPNPPKPDNYVGNCVGCVKSGTSNQFIQPIVAEKNIRIATNNKIWNAVRVPASEYTMNKGSITINEASRNKKAYPAGTWNQSSDRIFPHTTANPVPTRGNSLRSSITRNRPGSLKPGGAGVDIKHNSYARYLGRIKGNNIRKGPYVANLVKENAVVNNKVQQPSLLSNCFFRC